jgi:hypothetical protein
VEKIVEKPGFKGRYRAFPSQRVNCKMPLNLGKDLVENTVSRKSYFGQDLLHLSSEEL